MKIFQQTLSVSTRRRCEMVDITAEISEVVKKSEITSGQATVYTPHTTAAITINENADPDVVHDILLTLEGLIPQNRPGYRHGEGNSDAHVKSSLFGCSGQVLLKDAQLVLGTWQSIYFCEFDGPRRRQVIVQIIGNE